MHLFLAFLREYAQRISLTALVDILLVSVVIYQVINLLKGTRAFQLLKGLCILFMALYLTDRLHLFALNWLLDRTMTAGVIALVILFQPELRLALEQIGQGRFVTSGLIMSGGEEVVRMVSQIVESVQYLSERRYGALFVIERGTPLGEVMATGKEITGVISSDLMNTLFYPGSPLHDGAVVIRRDRVMAAGCILPLTSNPNVAISIGTRHRAALGLAEVTDAVVIVVSEETGGISLAMDAGLMMGLQPQILKERLLAAFHPEGRRRPIRLPHLKPR